MRKLASLLLLGTCALAAYPVSAEPPGPPAAPDEQALAAIRPAAIRAHMQFLADDLLEGRRTGSRGYELAAKYVAARFEALGLQPAGNGGYFQPVPLLEMTKVDEECSAVLVRTGGERVELRLGVDFLSPHLAEPATSVTAPVVFAGFGVTAPEHGHDDYAGLDVRGRIVAVLAGGPAGFPSDQRAFYSDGYTLVRNALAHGAVGILGIFTPEMERVLPWEKMVLGSRLPGYAWVDAAGRPRDLPPELRGAGFLSRSGAEALFAGAPKSLAQVFEEAATGKVAGFALPVEATLRAASRRERIESPNVVALLPGSDPRLRHEVVVLSAHLDHLGVGEAVAGDAIYNGALDNASGVAILLEVAGALARLPTAPRRSVLFLAVTAEEQGLHGSDYFARHPTAPVGATGRIVANVNLDMVLMLYPLRDVIAFGAEHSSLGSAVEAAARRLGVAVSPDPVPEQAIFIRSDHYSFVKQGVPSIFVTVGMQSGDPAVDGPATWGAWLAEELPPAVGRHGAAARPRSRGAVRPPQLPGRLPDRPGRAAAELEPGRLLRRPVPAHHGAVGRPAGPRRPALSFPRTLPPLC